MAGLTILYFPDIDEVPSRSTHWSAAPLVLGWISGGRGGEGGGGEIAHIPFHNRVPLHTFIVIFSCF